jgi:hypothetical protein
MLEERESPALLASAYGVTTAFDVIGCNDPEP